MRVGQKNKKRADQRDPRKTRILKNPYDQIKKKKWQKKFKVKKAKEDKEATEKLQSQWKQMEASIRSKAEKAVEVMMEVLEKQKKKKKPSLFEERGNKMKLTVSCVKLYPDKKTLRITLPHPFNSPENRPSICLFVQDLKKGFKVDHEPTVLHYQEKLKEYNINYITEVIPLRQLKADYKDFEAKRNLSNKHDVFLADNKIIKYLPVPLGKNFYGRKKAPLQVELRGKNWDGCLRKVLSKTHFHMDNKGTCGSFEVGLTSQGVKAIADNILASLKHLHSDYPGGWQNIRNVYLRCDETSVTLPIHVSFIDPNQVKRKITKKERVPPVVGETGTMANQVVVYPDGKVKVREHRKHPRGMEDEDSSDEDEELVTKDSDEEDENASTDEEITFKTPADEDEREVSTLIDEINREFAEDAMPMEEDSSDDEIQIKPQPVKKNKKKHRKMKKHRGFQEQEKKR